MSLDLDAQIVRFLEAVIHAMGVEDPTITTTQTADGIRVSITGDGLDVFVRRRGEVLDALQQVTSAVFRGTLPERRHVFVDCLDFRKGKDDELRQMARLLGDRAKSTGTAQEIGPLNPYARRLVHMAIAEDPTLSSESVGDAFLKTVIISLRND